MRGLILDLLFFICSFIAAGMVHWNIYPQYHESCIYWLLLGSVAGITDVIRRMVNL